MERERITLIVNIDLDPVPGEGHTPDSMCKVVQSILDHSVGHYDPCTSMTVTTLPALSKMFGGSE